MNFELFAQWKFTCFDRKIDTKVQMFKSDFKSNNIYEPYESIRLKFNVASVFYGELSVYLFHYLQLAISQDLIQLSGFQNSFNFQFHLKIFEIALQTANFER